MLMRITALAGVTLLLVLAGGTSRHAGSQPASASVPSAIELADHALASVLGPDDEGSYRLIDPIGPGGATSVVASDEVYATTLQGGKYGAWSAYRDPFAPQPTGPTVPKTPGQYGPGAPKPPHGGASR